MTTIKKQKYYMEQSRQASNFALALNLFSKLAQGDVTHEQKSEMLSILHDIIDNPELDAQPLLTQFSASQNSSTPDPERLTTYLMQLRDFATPRFQPCFLEFITYMLQSLQIRTWFYATNKCDFKLFNKGRVFKFAKILINKDVLQDIPKNTLLNQILEDSNIDTIYRQGMSRASAEDSDVDGIIKHRIDDFIASLDATA